MDWLKPPVLLALGEEVWKHSRQGGRASGVSHPGHGACGCLCSVVGDRSNAPQHHVGCFSACLGNMRTNVAVSLCSSRNWSIRLASKSRERSLGDNPWEL